MDGGVAPPPADPAEAAREVLSVSLDRVGGHTLLDGTIPIRCTDRRQPPDPTA